MGKFYKILIILVCFVLFFDKAYSDISFDDKKQQIIAVYNSNNLEEAYNMISKITESERDYELWYLLGNLAQDFNNDVNAVYFYQKSLILKEDFDKAHYNLANIYLKEKKYNSAIKEYKLAIKAKKDFPYYYYNMALAYVGIENYKAAKSALQNAIKYKNNEPNFYYNLAFVFKKLGKEKDAQKALETYNMLVKEDI